MCKDVSMQDQNKANGYEATIRLLRDNPDWYPIVLAALEEARFVSSGIFAGKWVLDKAKRYGVTWVPGLRKLVSYGVLVKDGESTRGGRRAYYSMPNQEGVEKALAEIGSHGKPSIPYKEYRVTDAGIAQKQTIQIPMFANLASCGSPNDSEACIEDYVEVKTDIAKPGYQYFLVRAEGDSMDLAEIKSGDLVLVRVQDHAEVGQRVVVSLEDGATIKELQYRGDHMVLVPRSSNPDNKEVPLTANSKIQGVVITTIPQ